MRKPRWKTCEPIELDGRTLEGGGQLLRNSVCLSALTGIPIKIEHIRGNRSSGGGLKSQHLACVKWLAHACSAKVEGMEKGSSTLVFEPVKGGEMPPCGHSPAFKKVMKDGEPVYECRLDIGTAGATGLALQAILPFILFSEFPSQIPVRMTISGGTNVSGSPSYEYISQVLLPTLESIGFPEIKAKLGKRGWSHGGSSIGNFTLEIPPRPSNVLPSFRLTPYSKAKASKPSRLQATFVAPASCHEHFREVLIPAVQHHFGGDGESLEITCEGSMNEKRMYLILVATIPMQALDRSTASASTAINENTYKLGRDWLYDRRIKSHERAATDMVERVTNDLANEVESGAYVDSFMCDQLVIFQALAQGRSEVFSGLDADGGRREPSLHARTAEWVVKKMLGVTINIDGACDGVGFGSSEEDTPLLAGGQMPETAVGEVELEQALGTLKIGGASGEGKMGEAGV